MSAGEGRASRAVFVRFFQVHPLSHTRRRTPPKRSKMGSTQDKGAAGGTEALLRLYQKQRVGTRDDADRLRGERVKGREMKKVKEEAAEGEERHQSWCREKIYLRKAGRQYCADWSDEPLPLNDKLHADMLDKMADEQSKSGGKVSVPSPF